MATVFISHSSRQDEFSARVCDEVRSRLKTLGWDVRIDMEALKGGEEWRSVIYHWLAECDAAVLLLGRRALEESPWVRREVNILLWRRALGSPLTIVPALVGDVRSADVANAGFSELEPLQYVRATSTASNDSNAEQLADQIAERFPTIINASRDDSLMHKWVRGVIWCLEGVTNQQALAAAARRLQAHDDWWPPSILEGHRFLAHQLLARALDGRTKDAVSEIAWVMETKRLQRLIPLVAPTWVDGESARLLLPAPNHQQPAIAILNALLPETAKHYVRRAACCALNYRVETVTAVTGENVSDEFLRNCEPVVRALLRVPRPFPIDGEQPQAGDILFLVVDPAGAKVKGLAGPIRALQARFSWLNVIILTGTTVPSSEELTLWKLSDALVLQPPLEEGDEVAAHRVVSGLKDILRQLVDEPVSAA